MLLKLFKFYFNYHLIYLIFQWTNCILRYILKLRYIWKQILSMHKDIHIDFFSFPSFLYLSKIQVHSKMLNISISNRRVLYGSVKLSIILICIKHMQVFHRKRLYSHDIQRRKKQIFLEHLSWRWIIL